MVRCLTMIKSSFKPIAKPSHAETSVLCNYLSRSVRKIFVKPERVFLLDVFVSHVNYVLCVGVNISGTTSSSLF